MRSDQGQLCPNLSWHQCLRVPLWKSCCESEKTWLYQSWKRIDHKDGDESQDKKSGLKRACVDLEGSFISWWINQMIEVTLTKTVVTMKLTDMIIRPRTTLLCSFTLKKIYLLADIQFKDLKNKINHTMM